jgi:DNA-binding beta-propeller fold protein YncE
LRRSLALPAALFSLAAAPLPAQVTVAASVGELNAGESSVLTAAWTGPGAQPAWEWILEPRGAGTLVQDGSARATYTAPGFPVEGEDVRLTAIPSCDRGAARIAMVRILPSAGMKVILDTIVAGYLGGDLFEPGLRLLAGSPRENGDQRSEGLGRGDAARFWGVFGMAFVERHPDPALQGRWLVATHGGLRVLSPEGDLGHWEGSGKAEGAKRGTRFPCSDFDQIAIRPGAGGPWEGVLSAPSRRAVYRMDEHGEITVLAGKVMQSGFQDGQGEVALFGRPVGVAYGLDGAVYVADGGNEVIRKIHRNRVSTLAGSPGGKNARHQDGKGAGAGFSALQGLALDPATGHLIVVDGNRIRQVTMGGEVTTLAGNADAGFHDAENPGSAAKSGYLYRPKGVSISRNQAFIADHGNFAIRILDLKTGSLTTLAGHPGHQTFREGRIPQGRPLDPANCAAMFSPHHVALNAAGQCLVSMRNCRGDGRGTCIAELALDRRDRPGEGLDAPAPDRADTRAGTNQHRQIPVRFGVRSGHKQP